MRSYDDSEFFGVRKILAENRLKLLKKENVVAVGIGKKQVGGTIIGGMAIVCSVKRKVPENQLKRKDIIPKGIDRYRTDVVETGTIRAMIDRKKRVRPAPGGVSIGHEWITAGTLGCLVKKNGETMILSNNHVLADSNNAPIGSAILQPGKYDGGTMIDRIGDLETFVPIEFVGGDGECPVGNSIKNILNLLVKGIGSRHRFQLIKEEEPGLNLVDAGIARPIKEEFVTPEILELGIPKGTVKGYLGMPVMKSGRTTGVTVGEIIQVDVSVNVQYGEGKIAMFVGQYMTGSMCSGGDSGSVVLDEEKNLVGLLFAGSDTTMIFNPIEYVFSLLDLSL